MTIDNLRYGSSVRDEEMIEPAGKIASYSALGELETANLTSDVDFPAVELAIGSECIAHCLAPAASQSHAAQQPAFVCVQPMRSAHRLTISGTAVWTAPLTPLQRGCVARKLRMEDLVPARP